MPEEPHVEEAAQADFGTPEPAMDRPTGVRQIVGRPAPAHLHDGNSVALLRQSMGGNTAAKTGANYNEIEIESCLLPNDFGGTSGAGFALLIV